MSKIRTAIFISGRGSNMRALIDAAQAPDYPATMALVLSNQPEAAGLVYAAKRGIPTAVIGHKPFAQDREAFERAVQGELEKHEIAFIALAGFMRVLTPWLLERWKGRIINIHPSLLPRHPGLNTHQRALDAGDAFHGCSVHHVISEVDAGTIIAQARLEIRPDDTAESLAARVLELEHELYPQALRKALKELVKKH